MTTYIIYHKVKPDVKCPDGFAAAWIAAKVYPDAVIEGWCHQTPPPDFFKTGDKVIIVDFNFRREIVEGWAMQGIEVEIIDHHPRALEDLSGLSNRVLLHFDEKECGATLTWKRFFPQKPMPLFLEYVRDRDLFDHLLPNTYEVHEACGSIGRSFELYDLLEPMTQGELFEFLLPIGAPLVAPKRQKVNEFAARHEWFILNVLDIPNIEPIRSYCIPIVRLKDESENRLVSDVASVLNKQYPEVAFSACVTTDGGWELRSNKHGNNFNVKEVAERFGGGGLRNASGFKKFIEFI